jgi:hypothetical protein
MFHKDRPFGQGRLLARYALKNEKLKQVLEENPEFYYKEMQGKFGKSGQVDSYGAMAISNQISYSGQWRDSVPNGHGECEYFNVSLGLD